MLDDPVCRLITLVGPGGMGKTRLATEAALAQLDKFSNGVYFVSLAALGSPEFLVSAIAEAMRFQFYPEIEAKQQLLSYLREKSMLLVLDNYEHLLAGVGIVTDILQAAPDVKILATSRERLHLQEEWVRHIEGLAVPDSDQVDQVEDYSALQLFVECAQRGREDFSLARERTWVIRICQLVEGMPLGILLAAAWVETLSLEEIAYEIHQSLDFLETQMRDLPARHRSIRAAFDWSWNRLLDEEREVFMKLSVFRGGLTREAAQAVAGASLRTLAALVNKSLLQHEPSGRYDVHELLRQYAEERLNTSPQASEAVHDLHAAYYAEFLHQRWGPLRTERQRTALDEIELEIDNVYAVWRYMVSEGEVDGIGKSAGSLWYFHDCLDRNQEGLELFGQAVEALRAVPAGQESDVALSQLLARQGWFYSSAAGLHGKGQSLCEESLTILRRFGNRGDMVTALDSLCMTSLHADDFTKMKQAA